MPTVAAYTNREVVAPATLNEIEANSISKSLEKYVDELETSPKDFKNFRYLILAEYNARVLAEDYMDKYQKKLLPKNEQLHKTALKFARKSSSYEVIKEVANNRNKLQNDRFAEMLIKTMKDCVDSAYIFASFRRQIRENANFEQILENQDIMKQSLNLLVRNMHLNPQRLPPAGIPTLDVAPQNNSFLRDERVITPPPAPAQRNAPRTQLQQLHRPTVPPNRAPINSNGPSWIVPEDQCRNIYNSNLTADTFARAYLITIFTITELMLPLKNIPLEKKNEFFNVAAFFFQNADVNWEATFEKVIKNLRFQKRQAVFKTLKETVGYGITSDGIEYFFTLPLNNQTQCYSNKECSVGSRLRTKACGNFRIPEKCGNSFQYILLIEKSGRLSKLSKLMPNGGITSIQN